MRVAIISTPRSGNTWLRRMLAMLCRGIEIAAHSPDELDWNNLPVGNCVLQLHWRKTLQLENLLLRNKFKVIVLQRHPLDVLISILQFAHQEPQTLRWLSGEGGGEENIYTKSPLSEAFLEYATGSRAQALLSVSVEWSRTPKAFLVRYEDLVSSTEKTLYDLAGKIGLPQSEIAEVIASNNIDALKLTSDNGHFWQGKVGLWRKVIPFHMAEIIAKKQQELFSEYGYEIMPNSKLTTDEAERNWITLCQ